MNQHRIENLYAEWNADNGQNLDNLDYIWDILWAALEQKRGIDFDERSFDAYSTEDGGRYYKGVVIAGGEDFELLLRPKG